MKPETTSFAAALWRGHLLLFETPAPARYAPAQGTALLLSVLFLEAVLRPLLRLGARRLDFGASPWWLLTHVSVLAVAALGLVFVYAKVKPAALGLRPWKQWSRTEKLYLLQIVPLATFIFSAVYAERVRALWAHPRLGWVALAILVPQLAWGFYQELLYRGMVQTELVRRLGSTPGVLLGNLLFTFGPLHAYHFSQAAGRPQHLWIFAAIFAIGLFFGVLFKRSGNLWIVGTMHGLGDFFIGGLAQLQRVS
jgi:CAAX protease family protein